jgi:ribonucleoside-diphosphate reductase alpha chain
MRDAKSGAWWNENPQRALANNSVAYKEKPEIGIFMDEWVALYKSKSGERGIFNRSAAQKTVSKLGERRDSSYEFGTNPCSEIILRDRQFCNLTEVIIRTEDTQDSIARKVKLASILGTWQASLTHFPYLSSEWKKNCQEEALLGVSMTGILDNPLMGSKDHRLLSVVLEDLKKISVETNKEWAEKLGINPAAAITCVKPSGTVSQLTDSASGIHARHSEYYVRTVRADRKDPLCQMMIDLGFPAEPCVMKPDHTMVFSFPMKAVGSITRNDLTAIEHLELWLTYQRHWCEHKPSITITVREHEWMEVGAWVYKHFDEISGISFLPHSDHSYRQAPYQECTKIAYTALLVEMPKNVDWSLLKNYEKTDTTASSQTFACSGDKCEIVDLTT